MSKEPVTPPADASPESAARFSLRSMMMLTAIVAIVVALCQHSLFATLAIGVPIVVYTVFSYVLHRQSWSGWACVAISILTSSLGIAAFTMSALAPRFYYGTPWLGVDGWILAGPCSFICGIVLGFIPLVLEYWLRFIVDSVLFAARAVQKFASRGGQS